MSRNRHGPFSHSRHQTTPFRVAATALKEDVELQRDVKEFEKAKLVVLSDMTEFASSDTSFLLYGQPALLRFPAIGDPLVVATFTVPPGRTLEIDRIDWWISEPFLYGNAQFGWRPTVNRNAIPFWSSQTPAGRPDQLFLPIAPNVSNEPRFSPLFLYAETIFEIEIVELVPGPTFFLANVWVSTYIYGKLRKPGGV